jgi:hypothetical protein
MVYGCRHYICNNNPQLKYPIIHSSTRIFNTDRIGIVSHQKTERLHEMEEGQDDNALVGSKPLSFKNRLRRWFHNCCLLVSLPVT